MFIKIPSPTNATYIHTTYLHDTTATHGTAQHEEGVFERWEDREGGKDWLHLIFLELFRWRKMTPTERRKA